VLRSSDHASIPKRGEKDFEPDGTDLQDKVLAESRQAMHDALCGERKHTSKTHVEGIWRPDKNMTEVKTPRGTHFKSLGRADNKGVLWLLPEETIYMVERGNLECWWEDGVPMSLQGAYASCLAGCGGLERYQVYAYLKRAGYILQRAPTFFDDGMFESLESCSCHPLILSRRDRRSPKIAAGDHIGPYHQTSWPICQYFQCHIWTEDTTTGWPFGV
jgi:tRNA-splicing endonuclease subunit Sen54